MSVCKAMGRRFGKATYRWHAIVPAVLLGVLLTAADATGDTRDVAVQGWLSWRGAKQDGVAPERLPDTLTLGGAGELWTYPLAGRGTPVIADGRVYTGGYEGEGANLQELLVCLDEQTGERIWEHRFNDFLSDVIYNRYSIGSPTIDARTGRVYYLTAPGLMSCFSRDGELLWQQSMMESFGRLTFPNGRTGSPVIDEDLAIIHVITANWGSQGPARDRFFAFDKMTGEVVWACTPGVGPKDSSFSMPVLAFENGRRVLYATTGCGNVVCIDARTGEAIWRYQMSYGGMNSSVVLTDDRIIAIHGKENIDASDIGRMIALRRGAEPAAGEDGPLVLGPDHELWRNDLCMFTSSPVLVGGLVFQTVLTGDLCCVDVATGEVLWHEKLAPDQLHASPLFAGGKLYVPMNNGSFYIIRPSREGAEILSEVQLEGNCLGAPAAWNGRLYVHTTEKLYCFGREGGSAVTMAIPGYRQTSGGPVARLQVVPSDLVARPGERVQFTVRSLDPKGRVVDESVDAVSWTVPPTVKAELTDGHELVIADDARFGTAVIKAAGSGGEGGEVRLRIVPGAGFVEDFDDIERTVPHKTEEGVTFAFPPSHWTGARLKWEVRDLDGEQVLAKTLDNALFQRTFSFIGHPDMSDYTTQVDIMSDGSRRTMSSAGLINQRYMITLKGNHQQIEISSNQERLKEAVAFRWRPNIWYTLKSRVDLQSDGSAVIRAKAWPRDESEPDTWNIEYVHANGNTHGSPGIFGFAPQSRFRVYLDNLSVTPNE